MHQGNWKCSSCRGAITELPFQPRSETGLTCRACYAKGKDAEKKEQPVPEMPTATEAPDMPEYDEGQLASEPMPEDDGFAGMEGLEESAPAAQEKRGHTGDWKCSPCGAAITSLPFEPRSTNNLKCLDCFKKG